MAAALSPGAVNVVGREGEVAVLEEFLSAEGSATAFLLTGCPGIGKTTLWKAGVDLARQRGARVLSARGSSAETRFAFAALIELLDDVGADELAVLPPPQRQALEVALFRIAPADDPPPPAAISVGFLNLVRALAARERLLVAIDDVQWLDDASAQAVAFAARRLDGDPVRLLLAKRSHTSSLLEREHGPKGLQRLEVGPLSFGATQLFLSERLGLRLPRRVLRRIMEATLGNPLFALELGRALADRAPLGVGEDIPLPHTVEGLLGARVESLPDPVRRLVLAVALNGELRVSQAAELAPPGALDEAVDLGVLVIEGNRLRPANPLFATAAKHRSRAGEQRELHLALAGLVGDDESRARHLALGTSRPDEELASVVAAAAVSAAARSARQDAVVLADHALRLTPAGSEARADRVLALGGYLVAAGEAERVTDLLLPQLDSLPPGAPRARALLMLTEGCVDTNDEVRRFLAEALTESGDDARMRAIVLTELATNDAVARVEGIGNAEVEALEAVERGRTCSPEVEHAALYALAWVRTLRGRAIDDVCERYLELSEVDPHLAASPDRIAAQRLVWRGDVAPAHALLTQLLDVADERGEPVSYALQRLHLCELELRRGEWDEATRLLDEWSREGELLTWPCYERCRALVAAGRGDPGETARRAAEAIASAERTGLRWDVLESLRARGIGALLVRDVTVAEESLGAVWVHTEREGVEEPGVFPVAPDLVEALVELGELESAQVVLERLRVLSEEQAHPWGLAGVRRCGGLIRLAERHDEAAVADLVGAAEEYGVLGLRFDRARSLLGLGRALRRLKKWGAARESLAGAALAFDELGSSGWAEQARSELARVGGRRAQQPGELTVAERRVVELAADGLANKEIASSLFVSVRTVEVHLKHAYAKLGIRSRTQLARRLSGRT